MKQKTNLLKLVTESTSEEINEFLNNVLTSQFIEDVKFTVSEVVDKKEIKKMIEHLQSLL